MTKVLFKGNFVALRKLFKNETLSFIFKVLFKGNTVALKKLKSFYKIFQHHNNRMPH